MYFEILFLVEDKNEWSWISTYPSWAPFLLGSLLCVQKEEYEGEQYEEMYQMQICLLLFTGRTFPPPSPGLFSDIWGKLHLGWGEMSRLYITTY